MNKKETINGIPILLYQVDTFLNELYN